MGAGGQKIAGMWLRKHTASPELSANAAITYIATTATTLELHIMGGCENGVRKHGRKLH